MAYRVSGKTGLGASVSVIVPTTDEVKVKLRKYREGGIIEMTVKDLEGREISLEDFLE